MLDGWESIETAPIDGSLVHVRRIADGKVIAEGIACYGILIVEYDNFDGKKVQARHRNVWVTADREYLFPKPTHWKPSTTTERAQPH